MILNALAERLKRRSKDDFRGRHFEAALIPQAVSWYLRYPRDLHQGPWPVALPVPGHRQAWHARRRPAHRQARSEGC